MRSLIIAASCLVAIPSSFAMAASCGNLILQDSKPPVYPLPLRAAQTQGTVKLRVTISPTGSIEEVLVTDGPQPLRGVAEDYVRSWVFLPGAKKGEPAGAKKGECTQDVSVQYKFTGPPVNDLNNFFRFTRDSLAHTTVEVHPFKPPVPYSDAVPMNGR